MYLQKDHNITKKIVHEEGLNFFKDFVKSTDCKLQRTLFSRNIFQAPTCYTVRCPASRCDPRVHATYPPLHILPDPSSSCNRTNIVPPINWWSWFDYVSSEKQKLIWFYCCSVANCSIELKWKKKIGSTYDINKLGQLKFEFDLNCIGDIDNRPY